MFSTVRRHTIFIITFLLAGVWALAGNNPEYRQTLFGKYGSLQPNSTVFTSDLNFAAYKNTTGAIEKTYYVKNAVRLMIDEESEWHALSDFTATLYLEINTENAAGTLAMVKKTLVLDFKKGQGLISGAISSYEFRDAVNVNVKIDSLKTNVSWDATNNLKLVNEIISLRDWGFNCATAITGIVTDSLFADEWKVKWNVPANFQSEYDLEWAWIDESAVADYTVGGNVDMNLVFDNNATRVSTSNNYYHIPLLYEEDGRLYARVRMAQKKVNGKGWKETGFTFPMADRPTCRIPAGTKTI